MLRNFFLLSCLACFSVACNSNVEYSYPENPENARKQRAGKFFDDLTIYDPNTKSKKEDRVNKGDKDTILWQASVQTIGGLLPISVADKSSGLISTNWHETKNNQEKIKINLIVKGTEIKAENLSLNIFKKVKLSDESWQTRNDSNSLSRQLLLQKIINKADQLNL